MSVNTQQDIECYLCERKAKEWKLNHPDSPNFVDVDCPSCGEYKIAYAILSHLQGLKDINTKQVLELVRETLISKLKEKQNKLDYWMIHDLLKEN